MRNLAVAAQTYRILEKAGIKPTYWNVQLLYQIAIDPGVSQSQLASRIDNPPLNLSPYLTKLVRSGVVARDIDMEDMRLVKYRLTTVGDALVRAINEEED